jgi:hypothetical protein
MLCFTYLEFNRDRDIKSFISSALLLAARLATTGIAGRPAA